MRKFRIAHLLWSFENGGIETMLVNIANEQVKHSDVSIVIIGQHCSENLLGLLDPRICVVRIQRKAHSRSLVPFLKLNYFLFRKRINVIHVHTLDIQKVLLPFFRKKMYGTLHATFAHKCITREKLSTFRKVFSISNAVAKQVEQDYHIKTIVCANGINCKLFKKKENWSFTEFFKIVQVGRVDFENKGQNVLLQALTQLVRNNDICVTVDFIGKGEDLPRLKEIAKDNNLENNVHFLGDKTPQYIQKHLCDYDLLVQPSYFEGFGLTVAEAMAAKVPVLVSDAIGPMEIIDNGVYGDFFKKGDWEECARKIKYLLLSGIDEKKVDAAYNRVISEYDVSSTAEKYLKEYAF